MSHNHGPEGLCLISAFSDNETRHPLAYRKSWPLATSRQLQTAQNNLPKWKCRDMYKTEATADWQSREEHGTPSCHWKLPWAHSKSPTKEFAVGLLRETSASCCDLHASSCMRTLYEVGALSPAAASDWQLWLFLFFPLHFWLQNCSVILAGLKLDTGAN